MAELFTQSPHCVTTIGRMRAQLDQVFRDIPEVCLPLLLPQSTVESRVSKDTGKQVYYTQGDRIIRYDLTNVLLNCPVPLPATRSFGVVARNGPTAGHRWKDFYQYDVDGSYACYGTELLRRGVQALCKIYTGPLVMAYAGFTPDELMQWPIPLEARKMQRDHTYYGPRVLEVYPVGKTTALLAGGCYMAADERIGFSLGLTRIAKLAQPMAPVSGVLCYVMTGQPTALIREAHRAHVPLWPHVKIKSLVKDFPRIRRNLAHTGHHPVRIVIHGAREASTGVYRYRAPGEAYGEYTARALIEKIAQEISITPR